jgi:hypothetical protein
MPLAVSDARLKTVMTFAADIPPEKRSAFLERVGAMLVIPIASTTTTWPMW